MHKNKKLIHVHIPKCAGSYVVSILEELKIPNKGHNLSTGEDGISFVIVRDPIERFESFLNYRLSEENPRNDWPKRLNIVYENKKITLNSIVRNLTDDEILNFTPYRTLTYWCQNVDIIITIDKLKKLLNFFGYNYDETKFSRKNISKKERGSFNDVTKERLKIIFKEDIKLYKKIQKRMKLF